MKILVTGATGCVGSALLPELKGEIEIFSRHGVEGPETRIGDIREAKSVEQAVKDADIVYHLAGLVDYGRSNEQLDAVNFRGTENVLKACKEHNIGRLIFTSTVGVYGDVKEFPIDEDTPADPATEYARSKYKAESLIRGQEEVPYTVLRPAPVYGPKSRQFAYLIEKINAGKLSIIGSGENKNHMVNSKNLAHALLLAQKKKGENETFVIADPETKTAKEIYEVLVHLLGIEQKKPVPYWKAYVYAVYNELRGKELNRNYLKTITQHREYSIRKAEEVLGYKPKVTLEQGMHELVEWCRQEGIV